jgi:hypothetical protein
VIEDVARPGRLTPMGMLALRNGFDRRQRMLREADQQEDA